MSRGKINLQANDGSVIGLVVPDGLGSGERQIALGVNLSGITAYHLLQGNLSVSNEVITNGFSTTLYTGNGSTQSINTGIDMDTQWGNDASETFGGLVWLKSRSSVLSHMLCDTVRGGTYRIYTNSTNADTSDVSNSVASFNTSGFSVNGGTDVNTNASTYASWNFQTTHIKTGVTNHGKAYTEHYNPFTGFTIIKYEGSGMAGHKIPHSLGRKLGFTATKNLSNTDSWVNDTQNGYLNFNNTNIISTNLAQINESSNILPSNSNWNGSTHQHIMYGWANSYYDESNKLIGNYEIGVYQGTGVAGNKVVTRGKPAWVMIKRIDGVANWFIFDNTRNISNPRLLFLCPNVANVEGSATGGLNIDSDGFTIAEISTDLNASGGQYLYMAAYDNDSGSGKSKYPKATDSSQLQLNTALVPFANGIDSNGAKNTIVYKNETITGLTLAAGKNYVYVKNDGTYGVKAHEKRMLASELVRRYAGESPDYFDVNKNKWFNTDAGSELVTNGTFSSGLTTGWVAGPNVTMSVINKTLHLSATAVGVIRYAYTTITVVPNKTYTFVGKIVEESVASTNEFSISSTIGGFDIARIYTAGGSYNFTFNSGNNTTLYVNAELTSGGATTAKFDDISVFPVDIVPTTEITESRNYLNHIVHADANGQVAYVEELPKVEYKANLKVDALDLGQKMVDYKTTKFTNIPYKNTSGKVKEVSISCYTVGADNLFLYIDDVMVKRTYMTAGQVIEMNSSIPIGATYKFVIQSGINPTIMYWSELE